MDLRPTLLEQADLHDNIRAYVERFQLRSAIRVELVCTGEQPLLPTTTVDHLYRVVQEALGNVARHARAELVEIHLTYGEGALRLSICDDGQGFDPEREVREGQGLGMTTLRERIELLGGWLRINSTPGNGTALQMEIPY